MNTFTIAAVQMKIAPDRETNLAKAEAAIAEAAKRGAQVVCLPELFTGYYFCQQEDVALFDLAEPIPGPSEERLAAAAKKNGVVVVGSLFEKRMAGVYHNTATVHSATGELMGIYRKMHIPDDPLFLEKFYFTPGDLGFKVFTTPAAKVGTLVCWDQWYPEAARLTALQGAEVIFYPTAIGWHPREKAEFGEAQHAAWETSMRGHAIANGTYVCGVNRVGHEVIVGEGLEFWGGSFVSDPFGRVVAKASHDKEEVLVVECSRKHMEDVRRNWPFFRDRRIDAYAGVTKRVAD
ncbi:apolipoprotein acyltransferase : Putative amidohydrolase OS=Singulisphaera acidiphila (strain ATCC BAA-1392 / DSM 18658 / VKM B-2454 / MOB10) GN=Sinac_3542 PE=4 SV=1: CN_hydrolase [Gemmataceae bacterium]|nr:apolipoprotein acyltransferase : Putative amidohydrolase OS=Singulisphaera acidiphila (strain ATCC BAA-1392 / DSM 18658 / VKM B-2454 / MOB10) GN=Sinac_3542 PE=4 SV=1: CN_hydrolase [Gemmataceae bacterium]VTT98310.1 apolipoprotein acyltransferase : Putative amidohydrolase OS=Singulisphaera acidiphila (strain ATCC BAA-1392 / DSM 18658 / VKM B-2454 / MOB10) GN=Sinac_3542 PE=4 SV=1: CN_hydrolase [Gemmataceae bacterium]